MASFSWISHAIFVSHPQAVINLIEAAANGK
jgi:hypothetical protein